MKTVKPSDYIKADPDEPVTLVVRHSVKSGSEEMFETWSTDMSRAALQFPGHLGVNIIRPAQGSAGDYVVMYRFDTSKNLRAWMDSGVRDSLRQKLDNLIDEAPRFEEVCGLEYWFETPDGSPPPPKLKMAFVTWLVLSPLVLFIPPVLAPPLHRLGVPAMAATVAIVAILVLIMTYAAMPLAIRLFRRWLHR